MNLLCTTLHENDQLRITTALLYKKQRKDNAFKKITIKIIYMYASK